MVYVTENVFKFSRLTNFATFSDTEKMETTKLTKAKNELAMNLAMNFLIPVNQRFSSMDLEK